MLVLAAVAQGGGWATVQLSSLPTDLRVGDPWNLTIRVLQHGNPDTPVEGARPRVTLEAAESGSRIVYTGEPTGDPGFYRFEIVFPEAGEWSYSIYDGFEEFGDAETHTYLPVTIQPPSQSALAGRPPEARASAGAPIWPIALGAAVGAAGLAACGVYVRRRASAQGHRPNVAA